MNLTEACVTLNVSRSGYHAHLRKHQRPRRRQDAQLATEICAAFCASRQTYGSGEKKAMIPLNLPLSFLK